MILLLKTKIVAATNILSKFQVLLAKKYKIKKNEIFWKNNYFELILILKLATILCFVVLYVKLVAKKMGLLDATLVS